MHFYFSKTGGNVGSSANIGLGQLWKGKQGKCKTPLRLCFAGCQDGLTGPQPPQWDGGEKGREVGRLPDDLADQVTQLQLRLPRLSSALLTTCQTVPPFRKHPSIRPAGPRAPGTSQGCSCVPISCQGVPCPNWGEMGKGEQGRGPQQTDYAMNSRGAWSRPTDLQNLHQLGQNWDILVFCFHCMALIFGHRLKSLMTCYTQYEYNYSTRECNLCSLKKKTKNTSNKNPVIVLHLYSLVSSASPSHIIKYACFDGWKKYHGIFMEINLHVFYNCWWHCIIEL